jgi:hypothetical protein
VNSWAFPSSAASYWAFPSSTPLHWAFQSSITSYFNHLILRMIYTDSITEEDKCTSRLGH